MTLDKRSDGVCLIYGLVFSNRGAALRSLDRCLYLLGRRFDRGQLSLGAQEAGI